MACLLKKIYLKFLTISKVIGLFKLSKILTSKKLRILCYHNFTSDNNLLSWMPSLHITPETLKKRINYITKSDYSILGLNDAVRLLKANKGIPDLPIVITIDDGWSSILRLAHPIFHNARVKYTVYLTSWYYKNNFPLFNLVVQFVLWSAYKNGFELKNIPLPFKVDDNVYNNHKDLSKEIINYCSKELSINDRYTLLRNICNQVMFDYDSLEKNKSLSLVDKCELEILIKDGVDIQLHTHTHKWPLDEITAEAELSKNRLYIESATNSSADHLCYPSGIWHESQFKYLDKNNIKSATTCEAGLNCQSTNKYLLHRFLDADNIPQIVFEANMSGFIYIMEKINIFKITKRLF